MNIVIGADHAGYNLKSELIQYLSALNYEIKDIGTFTADPIDYPDIVKVLCDELTEDINYIGVLICGTGVGMSIAANRYSHIRAALCYNIEMAKMARQHVNANVLVLGARMLDAKEAESITVTFLKSTFEGGRHTIRLAKIS